MFRDDGAHAFVYRDGTMQDLNELTGPRGRLV